MENRTPPPPRQYELRQIDPLLANIKYLFDCPVEELEISILPNGTHVFMQIAEGRKSKTPEIIMKSVGYDFEDWIGKLHFGKGSVYRDYCGAYIVSYCCMVFKTSHLSVSEREQHVLTFTPRVLWNNVI